jgi:hypothetical protein
MNRSQTMPRNRLTRALSPILPLGLAAAAAAFGLAPACHEHDDKPTEVDEIVISCEQRQGDEAFASDESWISFVEAHAAGSVVEDDCKAPALTAPAPGGTVDRTTPPTFTFAATQATCAGARAPAPPAPGPGPRARPRAPTFWQRLGRELGPLNVAHAHCPAVMGPNYVLTIQAGDGSTVYTALLSRLSFTPKAELWSKAMSGRGGQTLKVTVERAVFVKGTIMEGPFVQQQPFTLTVAP